jgi:hypothetical protein
MSTFTVNKGIEQPASGSYSNAWSTPVNADWEDIDNAFGGNILIEVTGAPADNALTLSQYQPPNIIFVGTNSGTVFYALPAGVGGIWTVWNNTTGSFTLIIGNNVGGGRQIALPQTERTFVVSDGTNVDLADTASVASAVATAEAFATAADVVVTTNTEAYAASVAATAQANAIATAANASNLSSGTVPNAQLPNAALMPGITIQADPGGTPSGAPGDIFYYY